MVGSELDDRAEMAHDRDSTASTSGGRGGSASEKGAAVLRGSCVAGDSAGRIGLVVVVVVVVIFVFRPGELDKIGDRSCFFSSSSQGGCVGQGPGGRKGH